MTSFSKTWLLLLLPLAGCPATGPDVIGDDDGPGPAIDADPGAPDGGAPGDPDGGVGPVADAEPVAPDAAPPDANAAPQVLQVCATDAPFTTVSAALATASAGDTIEVCAGTYQERLVIDDLAVTITGVGGPAATILDGGGGGSVVTVRNTTGAGVVLQGFTIQNGYNATFGGGIKCDDSTLVLNNNRLTANEAVMGGGGLATVQCDLDVNATQFDHNEGGSDGGGAFLGVSTGSIHHSWFLENSADHGGGLVNFEGDVAFEFNQVSRNHARTRAGALHHISDAAITSNAVIENTTGWVGGGIVIDGHAPLVEFNEVRGNSAPNNDGGGFYLDNSHATLRANLVKDNMTGDDGGGIRSFESACTLEGNTVENNTAVDGGGGIRISHVPCLVVDNIVRNNYAGGTGGGMDLDNDSSTIRGGEISGNEAGGSGGGIFTWLAPWSGTTIENVKIINNTAWKGGGIRARWNFKPLKMRGLTITGNHAGFGGGIMIESTNYTLTDSVIANNRAGTGAGLHHAFSQPFDDAQCGMEGHLPCPPTQGTGTVSFTVFYGNTGNGAAIGVGDPGLTVTSSIVAGHAGAALSVEELAPPPTWSYNDTFPATFVGMPPPSGDGNIEADPQFVNPAGGDFHLADGSACEDAGDPQLPPDGDGSDPDMGLVGGAP